MKSLQVITEFQDNEITHLQDKFDRASIKDPEWLEQLSHEEGWIVISGDPRITRGKAERAAWLQSGLTAFFFTDGFASRSIYEQASELFRRWPDIVRLARENPKGKGFLIPKKNQIELLD
jgi:hypothetical protein